MPGGFVRGLEALKQRFAKHGINLTNLLLGSDVAICGARNPICGAPFWGLVAHLACATHIKPQVTFICGARPYAPRIAVIPVAHSSTCTTHSLYGAPKGGASRINVRH
jgi:hypothetical protein